MTIADMTGLTAKARLSRCFGYPSRLSIPSSLRTGPLTAGKNVEATGISQSNVANHLGCLCACGLVVAE